MICISWRRIDDAPGKFIADQIKKLPLHLQASACLQIVAKHIENVFYNPDWFINLDIKQRRQLDILTSSGLDYMGSIPSWPIFFDLDYTLPSTSRFFEV